MPVPPCRGPSSSRRADRRELELFKPCRAQRRRLSSAASFYSLTWRRPIRGFIGTACRRRTLPSMLEAMGRVGRADPVHVSVAKVESQPRGSTGTIRAGDVRGAPSLAAAWTHVYHAARGPSSLLVIVRALLQRVREAALTLRIRRCGRQAARRRRSGRPHRGVGAPKGSSSPIAGAACADRRRPAPAAGAAWRAAWDRDPFAARCTDRDGTFHPSRPGPNLNGPGRLPRELNGHVSRTSGACRRRLAPRSGDLPRSGARRTTADPRRR